MPQAFLILVLDRDDVPASCSGSFTPGDGARSTHWMGGRVTSEPRSGRGGEEKIPKPNQTTYNAELRQLSLFHGTISHVLRH
jgi:hypothetical protein